MSEKVLGAISLMSAPAAKALGLPVKTMAPMDGSRSSRAVHRLSSAISGLKRALSAFGRLSVTEIRKHSVSWNEAGRKERWSDTQSYSFPGSRELDVLIAGMCRRR